MVDGCFSHSNLGGDLCVVMLEIPLSKAGGQPSSEVVEDLGEVKCADGNKSDGNVGTGGSPAFWSLETSPPASPGLMATTEPWSRAASSGRDGVCGPAAGAGEDSCTDAASAGAVPWVGKECGKVWISKSHPATSLMYRSMDLTSRAWFSGVDVAALMLPETM